MSYPIELTFRSGKMMVGGGEPEDRGFGYLNDDFLDEKTSIVANGTEIWSSYESWGLGLLHFRLGASKDSWAPEFHLKRYETYSWDRKKELIELLKELDKVCNKSEPGDYWFLFIRDRSPSELHQGIIDSLDRRFGTTLLSRCQELKPYQRFNWLLVAGRRPQKACRSDRLDRNTRVGSGLNLPFQRHIKAWQARPSGKTWATKAADGAAEAGPEGDAALKQRATKKDRRRSSEGAFHIMGQSLSTNCAEVSLKF